MACVTRELCVADFNTAAENKTYADGGDVLQYASCFAEEVGEFGASIQEYLEEPTDETRAAMVKEWADVQVVLSNLAWFFGIDGEEAFNRVHNNNMSKLVDGRIVRREDGKVLKPEGYQKPDMSGL
jgi:predicted HAD superfamily Cof-like phosphohydrolase